MKYTFKNWQENRIKGSLVGFGRGKFGLVIALMEDGEVNVYNAEYMLLKDILLNNKHLLKEGVDVDIRRKKVKGKRYYKFDVVIDGKKLGTKEGINFSLDINDLPF